MPVKYTVINHGSLVHVQASGIFTFAESKEYEESIAADPQVKKGYRELFDLSQVNQYQISDQELETIVKLSTSSPKNKTGRKVAIVIGSAVPFETARQYEYLADGRENVIVFNHISTAKKWLGIE